MFRCDACGSIYPEETFAWRCRCGRYLEYQGEEAPFPANLSGRPWSLWRYREALPAVADAHLITLGEGMTPLTQLEVAGAPVLFKLDYLCPTGSFKDRGTAVMLSWLLSRTFVEEVIEDSSGNAGASLAAYAARAGVRCTVFVPAGTSPGKLAQLRAYGAQVREVPGTRQQVAEVCQAAVGDGSPLAKALADDDPGNLGRGACDAGRNPYYASHNWNPVFLEGVKTFAFELWEQLGRVPDWVVVPGGYGGLLLGAFRGFRDLLRWGRAGRLPRLVMVQAERCCPVYRAFVRGDDHVGEVVPGETLAEGIACSKPVRGDALLAAVRSTGGTVMTVSEEDIRRGYAALARWGLYVEPTSATVYPAIERLVAAGLITPGDTVVAALTGSGLKSASEPEGCGMEMSTETSVGR